MALALTDEQVQLKQSLERYVERDYTFAARTKLLEDPRRFSAAHWQQFADLGWLAVAVPEAHGGLGGGAIEQAVVCEGLGRAMVLEPYISNAVLAVKGLEFGDDTGPLLSEIALGERRFALAHGERGGRYDLNHIESTARAQGNAFSLNGQKVAVLDAPCAHTFLVAARVGGRPRDPTGIALFTVAADAPGMTVDAYPTMDGTAAADLRFENTPAKMIIDEGRGYAALEAAVEHATIARCAQATGAMAASYEQTLAYVKTREQFGVPIGSFQVLQHRLVDLLMAVRECQSMVLMAASELDEREDTGERSRNVSAAKAFVGKRARKVAQEIVQIHGGIGMTEELPIGHFFRALTLFTTVYGSTAHHLARYTEATLG